VLTLPGANYAARQGAMQMSLVNLKEFIAASPDDFVAKAKGWMGRRAELGELRTSLRDRLLASPLCDAPRYVRNLEAALRAEWQKQLPKG